MPPVIVLSKKEVDLLLELSKEELRLKSIIRKLKLPNSKINIKKSVMIDELLSVDKSLNRESLFCLTRVDIEKMYLLLIGADGGVN